MAKKWKKSEEKLVIKYIKENPHNLRYAFTLVGAILDRSADAVSVRYYEFIRKQHNVFSIKVGDRVISINQKNHKLLGGIDFENYYLQLNRQQKIDLLLSLTY